MGEAKRKKKAGNVSVKPRFLTSGDIGVKQDFLPTNTIIGVSERVWNIVEGLAGKHVMYLDGHIYYDDCATVLYDMAYLSTQFSTITLAGMPEITGELGRIAHMDMGNVYPCRFFYMEDENPYGLKMLMFPRKVM